MYVERTAAVSVVVTVPETSTVPSTVKLPPPSATFTVALDSLNATFKFPEPVKVVGNCPESTVSEPPASSTEMTFPPS